MTGFRSNDGGFHGLLVAQFPDQDYVRVLSERTAQTGLERFAVDAHFALVHEGLVIGVQIFNGVFNGDDMTAALAVDHTKDRCQRGALAAAGDPGNEHQSRVQCREPGKTVR